MGHKIHPKAYRLGITENWMSRYFTRKGLPRLLEEDVFIRGAIKEKMPRMGIEAVEIERSSGAIHVRIRSSRPGMIIGRGGSGIEDLKKLLSQKIAALRKRHGRSEKFTLQVTVEEVRKPDTSAAVVAENIAVAFEKRTPFRRVIKQALSRVIQSKEVHGAKIVVSGKLDGAEISRTEQLYEGKMPLSTLRSDIDYAEDRAYCAYGVVGIKVWICKGEKKITGLA